METEISTHSKGILNTWKTCNTTTNNRRKEDIYYLINIEIEAAANQSNEEKICQNSKLECLNKEVFDIFYEDYID